MNIQQTFEENQQHEGKLIKSINKRTNAQVTKEHLKINTTSNF